MTRLNYFAYGSNLHPHRLAARVPSACFYARAELPGYRLYFHKRGADGSGKCNVVPDPTATVHGVIYTMKPAEKPLLDAAEGLHRGYRDHWLTLAVAGQATEIFLYRAEDTHIEPDLAPFDWYQAFVISGARYHGLPPVYIAALETVVATPDPDRARSAANQRLLRELPTDR